MCVPGVRRCVPGVRRVCAGCVPGVYQVPRVCRVHAERALCVLGVCRVCAACALCARRVPGVLGAYSVRCHLRLMGLQGIPDCSGT